MLALAVVLVLSGCTPEERPEVKYRVESPEQRSAAIKDTLTATAAQEGGPDYVEVDAFFRRLGQASRSTDSIDAEKYVSLNAMLGSLESSGLMSGMSQNEIRGFKHGFKRSATITLMNSFRQMAFDDHRLLRLERLDENELLAYVRHYDNEVNIAMQMRWWLVQTSDGLRIYDLEELSVGLRSIALMGTVMKAAIAQNPDPWLENFVSLARQFQTVDMADPTALLSMEEPLIELRTHSMPEDIQRFASMLMTSLFLLKGETEAAIAELETAYAEGYHSPLSHYLMGTALTQLELYEEALEEFEAHADYLGWDSDVLELVSDTYFKMGRMEEARNAALRGLEDNPGAISCLASLAAASTPEQLGSDLTRQMFADSGDPAWAYELAMDYSIDVDQIAQAKELFTQFKANYPQSDLISYYTELFNGR